MNHRPFSIVFEKVSGANSVLDTGIAVAVKRMSDENISDKGSCRKSIVASVGPPSAREV